MNRDGLISVFTDTWNSIAATLTMLCKIPDDESIIRLFTNEIQTKTSASVDQIQIPFLETD